MATPQAAVTKHGYSRSQVKARKSKPKPQPSGTSFAALDVVPEWSQLPELVELGFEALAEKRQKLDDEIKFRKSKMAEIDLEISAMLACAGTEKVTWQDRPVQIIHSNSGARVVPETLLMLGVPADTIAAATKEGKQYEYLSFGKPTTAKE